ncbi:hypothetical protein EAH_00068050 [Eimeria acervulina]|uniref:Uncharacterized protein n=1 Tax=Eimeria acervulina TaxID=5801 RepID=U6GUK5_EIMAC|nr:hypothetical protein EAH_00068050 [Eimeria acervulina]CDI82973.1 hypothetical protein EAH_00068050 [Eimeria acervulina]
MLVSVRGPVIRSQANRCVKAPSANAPSPLQAELDLNGRLTAFGDGTALPASQRILGALAPPPVEMLVSVRGPVIRSQANRCVKAPSANAPSPLQAELDLNGRLALVVRGSAAPWKIVRVERQEMDSRPPPDAGHSG